MSNHVGPFPLPYFRSVPLISFSLQTPFLIVDRCVGSIGGACPAPTCDQFQSPFICWDGQCVAKKEDCYPIHVCAPGSLSPSQFDLSTLLSALPSITILPLPPCTRTS